MPENEEFGKDFGLIQQVVMASRKFEGCRDFWASLAHNKGLLGDVIDFVAEWREVSNENRAAVVKWFEFYDLSKPFEEEEDESYWFRTSHCHYLEMSHDRLEKVKELDNLLQKIDRNKHARIIWTEMQCYSALFYIYSAIWFHKNRPGVKLMHKPFQSALDNLNDIINADNRIHVSRFLKMISVNPNVRELRGACDIYVLPPTSHFTEAQIDDIFGAARRIIGQQKQRVLHSLA